MNSSQGSTLQSKYHPTKIRYNIVPKNVAKFEHTQHCITTLRKGKKKKEERAKSTFFLVCGTFREDFKTSACTGKHEKSKKNQKSY